MTNDNYWKRRVTRRRTLQSAGLGAAGVAAIGLVGCGDDDDDDAAITSTATTAASAPAGSATAAASPSPAAETPVAGGSLSTFSSTDPPTLDVNRTISFNTIIPVSYIMSRLLRLKPQTDVEKYGAYEPEPDLAAAWEVPADLTTWTFTLREGVTFHNGAPFTSEDVAASFERFTTLPASNAANLAIVDKIATPDPKTVVFTLKSPFVPFGNTLSSPNNLWIYPKEIKTNGYDPAQKILGTGPFMFDSYESGVALRYKKNPSYFLKGQPYADDVTISIIKDTEAQLAQLRTGAISAYPLGLSPRQFESVQSVKKDIQGFEYPTVGLWFIYFQGLSPESPFHNPNSPFNDPRVRQAVSMAIDRDSMIKVLYQGNGRWNNIPPVSMTGGMDPQSPDMGDAGKNFVYDVEGAKKLLADAGYPDGFDTKLNYALSVYGDVFAQMVEITANMLKQVGINVSLNGQDYISQYIGKTFVGDFEGMSVGPQSALFEADEYVFTMFHSTSRRNHSQVKDPEMDRLIDAERTEPDPEKRIELIHDITRLNGEQMYCVPMTVETRVSTYQPEIRGIAYGSSYGAGTETMAGLWIKK